MKRFYVCSSKQENFWSFHTFLKIRKHEKILQTDPHKTLWSFFYLLTYFSLITSVTELYSYHRKLNLYKFSRKLLNNLRPATFWKEESLGKSQNQLHPVSITKTKIWHWLQKIEQNQLFNFTWKSFITRFHKSVSKHFVKNYIC